MKGPFEYRRTLFFSAQDSAAVLVTNVNGRRSEQARRFADAHAALTWCEQRGVMLVYLPRQAGAAEN